MGNWIGVIVVQSFEKLSDVLSFFFLEFREVDKKIFSISIIVIEKFNGEKGFRTVRFTAKTYKIGAITTAPQQAVTTRKMKVLKEGIAPVLEELSRGTGIVTLWPVLRGCSEKSWRLRKQCLSKSLLSNGPLIPNAPICL
ncbi:hypothetical protein HN51_042867 [Arachis hypogaea]